MDFMGVKAEESSSTEEMSQDDDSFDATGFKYYNELNLDKEECIKDLTFDTPEKANLFYKVYGWRKGFKNRICHSERNQKTKIIKNIKWECSCAGFRTQRKDGLKNIRRSRVNIRQGCQAYLRVALGYGSYTVTGFEPEHNHELLSPSEGSKPERCISKGDKYIISTMSQSGLKTRERLDFLKFIEGPSNLTFTCKDAHKFLAKERKNLVINGDSNTALSLLDGMKVSDRDFFYDKTLDHKDNSLTKLFWSDGLSRAQHKLFSDTIVLDSTYETNKYDFKLVIISGVDNNYKTCVFGAALLKRETEESYVWLLRKFLEVMENRAPLTVLTDQDRSICAAVKDVFPKAVHRLCSWHLISNCQKKVRSHAFANDFSRILKENLSVDEFELKWQSIVIQHKVENHPWVLEVYSKKEMWCEAYCRGYFMGNMRSSQRAESMNSRFKLHSKKGFYFTEFLKRFFEDLHSLRLEAYDSQCKSEISVPTTKGSGLSVFVDHAASVYSLRIREFVEAKIREEQGLIPTSSSIQTTSESNFTFTTFGETEGKKFSVKVDVEQEKYDCECKLLESNGLPCRHLFSALKLLNKTRIPPCCIRERWTTTIGQQLSIYYPSLFSASDPQRIKFGQIFRESLVRSLDASHADPDTSKSFKRQKTTKVSVDPIIGSGNDNEDDLSGKRQHNIHDPSKRKKEYHVGEPQKAKRKGAQKDKRQKCGLCGRLGHKKWTCPDNPVNKLKQDLDSNNRTEGDEDDDLMRHDNEGWCEEI